MLDLTQMRQNYTLARLDEESIHSDPLKQFEIWFEEARLSQITEPNAMLLATCGSDHIPSIRAVLLKIFDEKGFVFFTNYNSDKARDISENPHVALEFL